MIRRQGLLALLSVQLLLAVVSPAQAATPAATSKDPGLRSSSVLVLDASHSSVLYSKHANVAMPIASITKLMTALVVLEARQSLDETIEITKDDSSLAKDSPSRLKVGTALTRGQLMRLALMSSENRAAHALCRSYPGGLPACVAAMNVKAKALGMKSARFVEPTGLSCKNVASANDLAKLVSAAAKNKTISEYSTGRDYSVHIGTQSVAFRTTNSLVGNSAWNIAVQKTGYISEAGRCLVMQAVIEGRTVVIVLLNSVGKYTRTADARRVRRWMEASLKPV
jgi:D-alanyl-D-alanine endopeptidase (penicillin-binding protein 7)